MAEPAASATSRSRRSVTAGAVPATRLGHVLPDVAGLIRRVVAATSSASPSSIAKLVQLGEGEGQQVGEREERERGCENGERHPSGEGRRDVPTLRHRQPTGGTRHTGHARPRTATAGSGIFATELKCGTAALTHSFRRTEPKKGSHFCGRREREA